MIDTVVFIDTLENLAKKNQSGFSTGKDISSYINMAQRELAEYLFSIYELNQKVVDYITPLILTAGSVSSNSSGIIPFPTGYNHVLRLTYKKTSTQTYKTQYVGTNQVDIIQLIPQRRANLAKNRVLYTFDSAGINIMPAQELNFKIVYAKYPTDAGVTYTYTNVNGEPKRVASGQTDMIWGMNVFNLLLYMTMDKMGLSVRDTLLNEYARMGIAKEEVKPIT